MEPIALNDLPRWSHWPARITGAQSWKVPSRTIEKIDAEYDKDKYAKDLEFQARTAADPEGVMSFEFGMPDSQEVCFSLGDDLFKVPLGTARAAFYDLITDTLKPVVSEATTVVELGCGYGYNLWLLSQRMRARRWLGGEYAPNAVALAARLHAESSTIQVKPFNYYDATYRLLEDVPGPCVVFTSHSIEQLPSAENVARVLSGYPQVTDVFHFEPVRQLQGENLLGLLRARYLEVNDYNRDLASVLEANKAVQVIATHPNRVGINPLCPTSVIHWRPIR